MKERGVTPLKKQRYFEVERVEVEAPPSFKKCFSASKFLTWAREQEQKHKMYIIPGWNRKFCDRGECEMSLESGETPQIRQYFNNVF